MVGALAPVIDLDELAQRQAVAGGDAAQRVARVDDVGVRRRRRELSPAPSRRHRRCRRRDPNRTRSGQSTARNGDNRHTAAPDGRQMSTQHLFSPVDSTVRAGRRPAEPSSYASETHRSRRPALGSSQPTPRWPSGSGPYVARHQFVTTGGHDEKVTPRRPGEFAGRPPPGEVKRSTTKADLRSRHRPLASPGACHLGSRRAGDCWIARPWRRGAGFNEPPSSESTVPGRTS